MPVARLVLVLTLGLAACERAAATSAPLPEVTVADERYKGLVFLVASIRRAGPDFVITNDSTQPWFDVTVDLTGSDSDDYHLRLDEIDAGQSVTVAAARFVTATGLGFDAGRARPRTLIVSAEIGEGGPTGVYAVRL